MGQAQNERRTAERRCRPPKFPNEPVDTLMNANAIAKFDRKPRVRLSSGLMPSDSRCASSRAAWSEALTGPATTTLLHHRAATGDAAGETDL